MRFTDLTLIAGLALATASGLAGCAGGEEGPAEQAGKKVDAAVQGAADAAKEAGHDAAAAAGDAAEAVEKKLE